MIDLALSTSALALGPVLGSTLRGSAWALAALDGFVLAGLLGLATLHLLPEAIAHAGLLALVTAAIGALVPTLMDRQVHAGRAFARRAVFGATAVGLLLHAAFDGAALAGFGAHAHAHPHHGGPMLRMAILWGILLHRIPVSWTLWWGITPRSGPAAGVATLASLGLATVAGYVFGGAWVAQMDGVALGHALALLAGGLAHVVLHADVPAAADGAEPGDELRRAGGVGALIGLAFLAACPTDSGLQIAATREVLADLLVESAPALALGFTAAGLVQLLPHGGIRWLEVPSRVGQALRGMLFGLPLPVCSCGVVPLFESLTRRGAPPSAALAFLVATPELGLDALLLSVPLLGVEVTLARLVASLVAAVVTGALVSTLVPGSEDAPPSEGPQESTPTPSLGEALRIGWLELFDHTIPWVLFGLVVAAVMQPHLDLTGFAACAPTLQAALLILAGLPLYVCASAATPIAAVLLAKGIAPGAVLAFLIAGPASNVTTFGVLQRLHGRRVAVAFAATLAGLCLVLGGLADYLLAPLAAPPGLVPGAHEHAGWTARLGLLVLGVALASSLLRCGPRGLLAEVLGGHAHGHDHHPPPAACERDGEAEVHTHAHTCQHHHHHHHPHHHHGG